MRKARVICLVRHFDGVPKLSDFRIEEQTLPALKQNRKYILFSTTEHDIDSVYCLLLS